MDFLGRSQQFSEIVVFVKKDLTNKKGFCLFRTSDNREITRSNCDAYLNSPTYSNIVQNL